MSVKLNDCNNLFTTEAIKLLQPIRARNLYSFNDISENSVLLREEGLKHTSALLVPGRTRSGKKLFNEKEAGIITCLMIVDNPGMIMSIKLITKRGGCKIRNM